MKNVTKMTTLSEYQYLLRGSIAKVSVPHGAIESNNSPNVPRLLNPTPERGVAIYPAFARFIDEDVC